MLEKISTDQLQIMNKPISVEETKLIITHLKTNNAPGYDGFTVEFYKTFMEE